MGNNGVRPVRIGSRYWHTKYEKVFHVVGAARGKEGACALVDSELFISFTGDFVIVKDILNLTYMEEKALLKLTPRVEV